MSRQEYQRAILDDIDPAKYAGEGFFATDEYARPADIQSPYVRGDILGEEDYYPPPARPGEPPWPPHRRK